MCVKEIRDEAKFTDSVLVSAKLVLEEFLYELAIENLKKAEATEDRLQRVKYSAAAIVFAHAAVEAYFNWILEYRILTHERFKSLGEIVESVRHPVHKRWGYVVMALGNLGTGEWIEATEQFKKRAKRLSKLRNYVVHYKAKLIPVEQLKHTKEGVVITEEEQILTPYNAKEAVESAKTLILDLHKRDRFPPPKWLQST